MNKTVNGNDMSVVQDKKLMGYHQCENKETT